MTAPGNSCIWISGGFIFFSEIFIVLFLTIFMESSMVPYDNFRGYLYKITKGERNEKV